MEILKLLLIIWVCSAMYGILGWTSKARIEEAGYKVALILLGLVTGPIMVFWLWMAGGWDALKFWKWRL